MCPVTAGDHGHVLRPPQVSCGPSSPAALAPGSTAGGTGSWGGLAEPRILISAGGGTFSLLAPRPFPLQLLQAGLPHKCQRRGSPKPHQLCEKLQETHLYWAKRLFRGISARLTGGRKPCGLRVSVPSEHLISLVWLLQLPKALATVSPSASARRPACAAPGSCLVLLRALPLVLQDPGEPRQFRPQKLI